MSDLERDLRNMLGERAADIRSVPDGLPTLDRADDGADNGADDGADDGDEVIDLGLHRREVLAAARRRWPLLVAAAVVLAVLAGVLTALSGTVVRRNQPANKSTAPVKRIPTVDRATCPIADLGTWNAAVRRASFTPVGALASSSTEVDGVTANGDAVVNYDRSHEPTDTIGSYLGLLPAGSTTLRPLGYFGTPVTATVGFELDVDVDSASRTAVVSLNVSHGNAGESVTAIYALDLDTGRRTRLMSAANYPKNIRINQGYIQDSTVYWETDSTRNYDRSRVYAVPVAGGVPRVVARSNDVELEKTALGIDWSDDGTVDRPADVPTVVAHSASSAVNVPDDDSSYVTDGTAYAWGTEGGALDWFSPETGRVLSFRGVLGVPGSSEASMIGVAGPLVYFQAKSGQSHTVLDTRTGALIPNVGRGALVGGPGGVAVGDPLVAPSLEPEAAIMRLDTATLPAVRC